VTESNTSNLSILHCPPTLELSGDYHKILSGSIFLLLFRKIKIDSSKELDLAKASNILKIYKILKGKSSCEHYKPLRTEKEHQINFGKITTLQQKLFSFRRHSLPTCIIGLDNFISIVTSTKLARSGPSRYTKTSPIENI
jgi:hypothetical protein